MTTRNSRACAGDGGGDLLAGAEDCAFDASSDIADPMTGVLLEVAPARVFVHLATPGLRMPVVSEACGCGGLRAHLESVKMRVMRLWCEFLHRYAELV